MPSWSSNSDQAHGVAVGAFAERPAQDTAQAARATRSSRCPQACKAAPYGVHCAIDIRQELLRHAAAGRTQLDQPRHDVASERPQPDEGDEQFANRRRRV